MDTEGVVAPDTAAAARDVYRGLAPAAKTVVRETTRAMAFDRAEYRERVTGEVVETARDALFASLLVVSVGTRAEFDAWRERNPDREVHLTGSPDVDRVVWHAPAFTDAAVAATFHEEREAAVGTLRRQAFGRLYRPLLESDAGDESPPGGVED
jgi:hypothetical protein